MVFVHFLRLANILCNNEMKLELGLITSNLCKILISFPRLEFCKRKGKNYKNVFVPEEGLVLPTHMCLLSILSLELLTCVSGITYMPVLKLWQGLGPNEDQSFE